jgi:hypothetical protein
MTPNRIYGVLLHLYPRRFREEYGADMLAAFAELKTRRAGTRAAFWAFVLRDTIGAAARERLDAMRWLATAACGLLVTTIAGDAGAWAYRYFYHPYFEGLSVPVLPYGIALGLVLGASIAIAQRLLFPSAERRARHWMLASAVALPVAVLFCSAAIDRVATGVLPIANAQPAVFEMFALGLARSRSWSDLATQFVAMAASALVVRSLLTRPSMWSRHAH